MSNLREIRGRINSVRSTMKITNAMYLLASSKVKKARRNLDATAPFFQAVQSTMADILAQSDGLPGACGYFRRTEGEDRKRLFLLITSDKGLAGSYNHNITRLAEELVALPGADRLMFIGYSGRNYFLRRQKEWPDLIMEDEYTAPAVEPVMWRAVDYARHIAKRFREGDVDEVHLVYTRMVNALSSQAECLRLLPLEPARFRGEDGAPRRAGMVYLPSPEDVFTRSVPNYLTGLLYGAMVESYAAEQNARMQAMDSATGNAREMLQDLSLLYNRVRQAAITQEITEVVGGSQARER